MDQLSAAWAAVFDAWDAANTSAWQAIVDQYTTIVNATSPDVLAADLQAWVEGLEELGDLLVRWQQLAAQLPPDLAAAEIAKRAPVLARWQEYNAGFWPFVTISEDQAAEGVGLAPVVLVAAAGTLAIGAVAAAFAVGSLSDLGSDITTATVQVADLDARVLAMQSGQQLQPSTLPPPPPDETGYGPLVFGGLLLLGLGAGVAWKLSR